MERFLLYKFFLLMNINIKNRFMGGAFWGGDRFGAVKITTRSLYKKQVFLKNKLQ